MNKKELQNKTKDVLNKKEMEFLEKVINYEKTASYQHLSNRMAQAAEKGLSQIEIRSNDEIFTENEFDLISEYLKTKGFEVRSISSLRVDRGLDSTLIISWDE